MYVAFLWICSVVLGILLLVMVRVAEKLQQEVVELRERVAEQESKHEDPFEEFENRPS